MASDIELSSTPGSPAEVSTSSFRRPKQLIFDRRYGWLFEEWVEPSEYANVGGRGLFSIVPLTAATINLTYKAADGAADLIVQCIEKRSEIAAEVRNRWTSATLQACQEVEKRVSNVTLLRKKTFPALSGVADMRAKVMEVQRHPILQSGSRLSKNLADRGRVLGVTVSKQVHDGMNILQQAYCEGRLTGMRAKVMEVQRHPILQSGSRLSRNLADHGKVVGVTVSKQVHDGMNILQQAYHDGRRTAANEQLHRLLPELERKRHALAFNADVKIHELFPIPPDVADKLRKALAEAGEQLQQLLLVQDGKLIGSAFGAQASRQVDIFSEVLSRSTSLGYEVSRQARDNFDVLLHASKDLSSCAVHQIQQTGKNLSHSLINDKQHNDGRKMQGSNRKEGEGVVSSFRADIGDDDEVPSRSPLFMVAAADDEDDEEARAPLPTQFPAPVVSKLRASSGKRSRKEVRNRRVKI